MRFFSFVVLFTLFLLPAANCISQGCCSGGSGSPIAGGASQGVLLDRQMELAGNFQYIQTDKFFSGSKDTIPLFKSFLSNYLYGKVAYGVTKDFTMSVEAGYFLGKRQIGISNDTAQSKGIADLILFPRYDVYNHTDERKRVELTVGMGLKIPLGKYMDSTITYHNPTTGQNYYTTSPPTVQPTNGSHDFIFYSFFFRGFPLHNFRLFANAFYIKKGWNPLGEKFGDYSSISLFAGKTVFKKLGITVQLKGEHIAKMKSAKDVDILALYNVDTASTGVVKVFVTPQLSYTFKSFTIYGLSEFPIYQYVNKAQIASQYQFTLGVSYRFFTVRSTIPKSGDDVYACSMKCPEGMSNKPGKCKVCGMELKKE